MTGVCIGSSRIGCWLVGNKADLELVVFSLLIWLCFLGGDGVFFTILISYGFVYLRLSMVLMEVVVL